MLQFFVKPDEVLTEGHTLIHEKRFYEKKKVRLQTHGLAGGEHYEPSTDNETLFLEGVRKYCHLIASQGNSKPLTKVGGTHFKISTGFNYCVYSNPLMINEKCFL